MSLIHATHTAELPRGDQISFTDSGPVPGFDDYVTVVALSGAAFNANTFRKLYAFVAPANIRLIVMTKKDYKGSTSYTHTELDDLKNGRQVFLDNIATLIANFTRYIVHTLSIPKVTADRRGGGISILGWSIGVSSVVPLFSGSIGDILHDEIKDYLKDIIIYDPPFTGLGYQVPQEYNDFYNPWRDPQYRTVNESLMNFSEWISCYFYTPNYWSGDMRGFDKRKRTERSTLDTWDEEEIKLCFEEDAALRSELPMFLPPMQAAIRETTKRALFDETVAKTYFPNSRILYLACGKTPWRCSWTAVETKRLYDENIREGKKLRPIKFLMIENGNHFAHYDIPEEFVNALSAVLTTE